MTALPALPSATSSIPLAGALSARRRKPNRNRRSPIHPLDRQGIRRDWFTRGIAEANCALFHASLYPVLPVLDEKIQSWLAEHQPDGSMASDRSEIATLSLGVIVLAFEHRHQWSLDQAVVPWLASFIAAANAADEST